MPRKKTTENYSLERLYELLDEQSAARGAAVLAAEDATAEIARFAAEARRKGATMPELRQHVRKMDVKTRKMTPISRQFLNTMIAVHEKRAVPKTTRASRRSLASQSPAGQLNAEALK